MDIDIETETVLFHAVCDLEENEENGMLSNCLLIGNIDPDGPLTYEEMLGLVEQYEVSFTGALPWYWQTEDGKVYNCIE